MRHRNFRKGIEMEVLSILVMALEERGCDPCHIGSIWQAAEEHRSPARTAKAVAWAFYLTGFV